MNPAALDMAWVLWLHRYTWDEISRELAAAGHKLDADAIEAAVLARAYERLAAS